MAEQLPATIKQVWVIGALLNALGWLALAAALWVANSWWAWPLWLVAIALALAVLHPLVHLVLIPYRYAFWRYQITPDAVYLKKGAIFRKEEALPITRIQNVTLEAGPVLAHYHLQAVSIETASTKHEIDGVTPAVAAQLRDQIMQLAMEARDEA